MSRLFSSDFENKRLLCSEYGFVRAAAMCKALREIMAPEIERLQAESKEEGRAEGRQEGINIVIKTLRKVGQTERDIKDIIIENFRLLPSEAEKYMAI